MDSEQLSNSKFSPAPSSSTSWDKNVNHVNEWFSFVRAGNLIGIQSVLLSSQVNSGNFANIVQSMDEMGMTALHWAARTGQLAVARYLVQDAGANVFSEDSAGMRASEYARELYYMDLARFLEGQEVIIQEGVICMQVKEAGFVR